VTRVGLALLGVLAAFAPAAVAESLTLSAPKSEGPSGGESVIALRARVDVATSALQGAITYDPSLFDVLEVVAGTALPEGARADANADQPGWLRLGFVCSPSKPAFRGEGEVLRIRVRAKGSAGRTGALALSLVRAWEPTDAELRVVTEDGTFVVVEATSVPWIPLAATAGTLLLLGILFKRSRRRQPVAATPTPPAGQPASRAPGGGRRFCTSCGAAIGSAQRFCGSCGQPVP
jgi:hypothetical protein